MTSSTQRGITVSYSYDLNGNRLSVGTPTSTTVYSYDARNRVKTASTGSATTTFDYYLDGKKKTVTYPNTAKEEYEYYQTNRVKTITNTGSGETISRFEYTYDANGNRTSQLESGRNRNKQTSYTFDTLAFKTGTGNFLAKVASPLQPEKRDRSGRQHNQLRIQRPLPAD